MTHLSGAAEKALRERRGLLLDGKPASDPSQTSPESHYIAYPLEILDKLHGVVVLEVAAASNAQIQTTMRQLHWGAAWVEVMIRRSEAIEAEKDSEQLRKTLDLVSSAMEHERFEAAAMGFAARLAVYFECDRVSLGFLHGQYVRVDVMSHSSDVTKKTNLMNAIGTAMDEAIDQKAVITYPPASSEPPFATRAHENLFRTHGAGAILTIPLEIEGRYFGAMTLERPHTDPFDEETVRICTTVATVCGDMLRLKREEEKPLFKKAAAAGADEMKRLLGPGHLGRKTALLVLLAAVAFFSRFDVLYRVTAPTLLEGSIQRVIAAPFEGYVKTALKSHGDTIQAGDVLCVLDDRDFRLERFRWTTEKAKLVKQYYEAMSAHERAKVRILQAKIEQAEAQIALLDEQLARTQVRAPFDAVITSGDLSQSLGVPVERGQVLFEVAPLDAYRVIARVDERDITRIRVGQKGELVLPSIPNDVFPFSVQKVTPVSKAEEGRTYYRVEGRLTQTSQRIRPGMEGVGKINIEDRKLIWVWTHELIDWVRLQMWRWRP